MAPEIRFQFNEHGDQFLVTLHELPLEGVAADQDGDVCPLAASHSHVMLHLAHVLVRDGILPFASLISGGSFGLEDTKAIVGDLTDAIQVCQHEGVFLALEDHAGLANLDSGALGELGPDNGLQLCPPIGSLPGLLGRELPGLVEPQFYRGLIAVYAADYGSI